MLYECHLTFYGAPLCFPSQDAFAIHLVLLVAAHHSERDHFLSRARTHAHKNTFTCKHNQWRTKTFDTFITKLENREETSQSSRVQMFSSKLLSFSFTSCCYAKLHRSLWTYPYFVIDQPVVCVLVELFLRVNIDPVGPQLFPDLQIKQQKCKVKLATHTPPPRQPAPASQHQRWPVTKTSKNTRRLTWILFTC